MEEQNKHQNNDRTGNYHKVGRVIFFGAAIGTVAGLLLLDNPTLGMGIGAAAGVIVGAMLDKRKRNVG